MSLRAVDKHYVVQSGEVLFNDLASDSQLTSAFPGYASAKVANDKVVANRPILMQLQVLDTYIPRGLEDMWSATGFNTTTLPSIQQTRLAQKLTLRSQIQH